MLLHRLWCAGAKHPRPHASLHRVIARLLGHLWRGVSARIFQSCICRLTSADSRCLCRRASRKAFAAKYSVGRNSFTSTLLNPRMRLHRRSGSEGDAHSCTQQAPVSLDDATSAPRRQHCFIRPDRQRPCCLHTSRLEVGTLSMAGMVGAPCASATVAA